LDKVENTRAQTLAGLMARARLAQDDEQLTQSLVKDLCALAEAVQS
jgi:hypothetical protein